MDTPATPRVLIDGCSRLIIESLVQSGAEAYVGYPITPANWLYGYASLRFPTFLAAPDEISALQWAAGLSATGKLAVTGTSFPGLALMLETLNKGERKVLKGDFYKAAGKKGAALGALAAWMGRAGPISIEALRYAAKSHKRADSLIAAIEAGLSAELHCSYL